MTTVPILAELTFIGRASVKIKYADGTVIYIDPYAGEKRDYSEPADLILVTHQHEDHNQVNKVTHKSDTQTLQCPHEIHAGVKKTVRGIAVHAVPAYNKNHAKESCCGYVVNYGGLTIYHSGDTSHIAEMKDLKALGIDYALLCMDGFYNMGPTEAMAAAADFEPKVCIPIHSHKNDLYDPQNVHAFTYGKVIDMKPGDVARLTSL